jgi:dTDP-4-dehydrorhamnose 3,5-epimerase
MTFTETILSGAFVIDPERAEDERGFFARLYTPEEFAARGLDPRVAQCAVSFNRRRGTLRGMHYQEAPHAQAKLVRCTMGAIHDVALDLRPGSHTFGASVALELSARNRRMLYVPEGLAHGFLTLEDDTEVAYQMSSGWHAASERGVRWDDPAFAIAWPFEPAVISDRDRGFALWAALDPRRPGVP